MSGKVQAETQNTTDTSEDVIGSERNTNLQTKLPIVTITQADIKDVWGERERGVSFESKSEAMKKAIELEKLTTKVNRRKKTIDKWLKMPKGPYNSRIASVIGGIYGPLKERKLQSIVIPLSFVLRSGKKICLQSKLAIRAVRNFRKNDDDKADNSPSPASSDGGATLTNAPRTRIINASEDSTEKTAPKSSVRDKFASRYKSIDRRLSMYANPKMKDLKTFLQRFRPEIRGRLKKLDLKQILEKPSFSQSKFNRRLGKLVFTEPESLSGVELARVLAVISYFEEINKNTIHSGESPLRQKYYHLPKDE